MNRFKQFIFNGLLITAVSLLIRTVSVSFNIYLSNKIGAVAMGLFTLISTVYGFAITLATSGIGLASTKMIAQALGSSQQAPSASQNPLLRGIVRKCVCYALCFSISSALLLFILSPVIGSKLLLDERTVLPLRVLAFTLPPIAVSSVLNGYFIAVRRVYKNAIVQILGQAVKIYGSIFLLTLLSANDVESACLAIVLGGAIAELISFLCQYILFVCEKRSSQNSKDALPSQGSVVSKLLHIALPVAFSAYVRSGLVTLEHMLIPWGLERSGSSRDRSLAAYGIVHSMVFPLVLFPSALTGSFASLLIPEISEAQARDDTERIDRIIAKVFETVLIFAIGTAGILMCFSYELSHVVYPRTDAGKYILMIAPLVPVMYLDTSVDSLLKGMGEQFYCMIVNIVDASLSVVLVWLLLPKLGILGYIITVYFTETVNATLSITRLLQIRKIKPHLLRWIVKPILGIIASTALVRKLLSWINVSIASAACLTTQIVLTALLYFLIMIVFHEQNQHKEKSTHIS